MLRVSVHGVATYYGACAVRGMQAGQGRSHESWAGLWWAVPLWPGGAGTTASGNLILPRHHSCIHSACKFTSSALTRTLAHPRRSPRHQPLRHPGHLLPRPEPLHGRQGPRSDGCRATDGRRRAQRAQRGAFGRSAGAAHAGPHPSVPGSKVGMGQVERIFSFSWGRQKADLQDSMQRHAAGMLCLLPRESSMRPQPRRTAQHIFPRPASSPYPPPPPQKTKRRRFCDAPRREMWAFCNDERVRHAMHAAPISHIGAFDECTNGDRIEYTSEHDSMLGVHAELVRRGASVALGGVGLCCEKAGPGQELGTPMVGEAAGRGGHAPAQSCPRPHTPPLLPPSPERLPARARWQACERWRTVATTT